ncbi:tyrosine-type recombinase/integrase [Janthinobacterium sp. MDT1-19]|uniref:tyrosine-type recombinase/integrase n=1 Tax=Janthinobacterium sp. MDT1-19 TaxID=1259339 RepID=UPI003F20D6AE
MGKLTVRSIDGAKPKEKPYKLMDGDGLQLRVAVDGVKTWLVRYVITGTERQYRLPKLYRGVAGPGYCSLQEARDEAAKIRALARQGIDYAVQLEERRAAIEQAKAEAAAAQSAAEAISKASALTVQDMFDAWITDGVRRKDGNAMLKRMFATDVLPAIGAVAIKDVTEHHLRAVLRAMVERGVNRSAVMQRNSLTQMFAWARKRQPWRKLLVDGDPMELIEIEKIVSPDYDLDNMRDRILSADEIRELHTIIARMHTDYDAAPNKRIVQQPLEATTERAIWIMLSTMCRVGETAKARWEHVDLTAGTWFIPKENVKDNVADLTVYLSAFALDQFQQLHARTGQSAWCFPARNNEASIEGKSISKQVGDRQSMFKKNKDGTPRAPLKNRRSDDTLVLAGGKNGAWTPHDLRRTGATMMQALGISLELIDRCQNHVLPGSKVRRHYMLHDYADEKRAAWAALGERLSNALM